MKILTGADIEQTDRFSKLLENRHFMERIYTEQERSHIRQSGHPEQTAAGIFCAKEAISKALGRGLFGLLPQELGIRWNESGAPYVVLTGSAFRQYGQIQLSISISHTGSTAFAVCTGLEE